MDCKLVLVLALATCACRSDRNRYEDDEWSASRGRTETETRMDAERTTAGSTAREAAHQAQNESARRSLSANDRDFVAKAAVGGMFEVQSSELALQKNVSAEHREFAQMMIEDHGRANRKLEELAQDKGLTLPATLDRGHQDKLEQLRAAEAREFERLYHEMQVEAHDQAIEMSERCSRECEDREIRAFAADTLPKLREHRRQLDLHRLE
jgi:putative membrane protein